MELSDPVIVGGVGLAFVALAGYVRYLHGEERKARREAHDECKEAHRQCEERARSLQDQLDALMDGDVERARKHRQTDQIPAVQSNVPPRKRKKLSSFFLGGISAAAIAVLFFCGCAIRTAPVGTLVTKPDGHGGFVTHANPDLQQPDQDPGATDILGMLAGLIPGPAGAVASALTLGLGLIAGRRGPLGTIKRMTEAVDDFESRDRAGATMLKEHLSKRMDSSDKRLIKRVKP